MRVRRGDLFAPVAGRRFGLVLSNPPYVPAATDDLPRHRKARCWDAGPDGRALLDRICAGVADVLTADGTVLLVHSAVCDTEARSRRCAAPGCAARELARVTVPFGPVMHAARARCSRRAGSSRAGSVTRSSSSWRDGVMDG